MDNITHTLIGGALARTGLDRRTPLAVATMMIGANFPDIDVIAVPLGTDIGVRRGITHGIPAHIILPFVLTGIMLAWDRWVRRRRNPALAPAIPREILLLSAISIATHPFFDWLNSYGMRWLMPMRNEWFYGDSLFIADLWLWLALGIGFWMSGRRKSAAPARAAVAFTAIYVAAMMGVTAAGRLAVRAATGAGASKRELMVSPVAVNPLARQVIVAQGGVYRTGQWSPGGGVAWGDTIPINRDDPAVAQALTDPVLRPFLHWSRFPFFVVTHLNDGTTLVEVADARYNDRTGGGWAARSVTLPAGR